MAERIYVPLTSTGLAALVAEGRLGGPLRAHAVTDELRSEWSDGDDEGWEYAALMAAAGSCRGLRGAGDRPRRYVLAADVPSVSPVAGEDPTLVDVAADVPWKNVAALHADTEDRPDDADEDDDLAWFATQEIQHLL
ncbi:hypothetical protein [Nocardioides sp.]|uniref:DUF6912 family protein n=1 Tax=Nocardioides sp. TaxID=35761 RepID=UPI0035678139